MVSAAHEILVGRLVNQENNRSLYFVKGGRSDFNCVVCGEVIPRGHSHYRFFTEKRNWHQARACRKCVKLGLNLKLKIECHKCGDTFWLDNQVVEDDDVKKCYCPYCHEFIRFRHCRTKVIN